MLPRGLLDDVVAAMAQKYYKHHKKRRGWILDLGSGYQSAREAVEDSGFDYVPGPSGRGGRGA